MNKEAKITIHKVQGRLLHQVQTPSFNDALRDIQTQNGVQALGSRCRRLLYKQNYQSFQTSLSSC